MIAAMRNLALFLAAPLALVIAGVAPASTPVIGYLTPATAPDTIRILPPAPVAGDGRDLADQAIFRQTRNLKDTPRWALAQDDIDERAILKDFACAVGVELSPAKAPRLAGLLARAREDVRLAVNRPKDHYGRKRPYLVADGAICAPRTPDLAASADYPSGHATWGWSVALILAELAPDRATDILVRGRSFGESRVVCGVHGAAAVEAGRTNASAVVAALHGDADFRADLEAARAEVKAARQDGPSPDATACQAQGKLVEKSPY
jgi:acid phosphatase (class A)